MVIDGLIEAVGVLLSHLHVVHTDAVVSEGLSVHITDGAAHLQELFVLLHGLLVFAQVVVEYACRVVGAALIATLTSTLAGKSENFVILEPLLCSNAIVTISVTHRQPRVVS